MASVRCPAGRGQAGEGEAFARGPRNQNYTTAIAGRLKGAIVRLALWGLIPIGLADWIIRRGGLLDA